MLYLHKSYYSETFQQNTISTMHSLKHLTSFHFETGTVLFKGWTVHHFEHFFDGPEFNSTFDAVSQIHCILTLTN